MEGLINGCPVPLGRVRQLAAGNDLRTVLPASVGVTYMSMISYLGRVHIHKLVLILLHVYVLLNVYNPSIGETKSRASRNDPICKTIPSNVNIVKNDTIC